MFNFTPPQRKLPLSFQTNVLAGFITLASSLALTVGTTPKAQAISWNIGNSTNDYGNTEIPYGSVGQGFTPTTLGDGGSGSAPSSGSALLNSFTIPQWTQGGTLYIFSNPISGTPDTLATQPNLVGSSSAFSGNTWNFGSGLLLNSVNNTYYAYTGSLGNFGASFFSRYGNNTSEIAYFYNSVGYPLYTNPFPGYDLVFNAQFSAAAAVPFDFSPEQGMALGVPLFIGLRMLSKKLAVKNSKNLANIAITAALPNCEKL